jgi:uncharacterized protein YjbI with pentapeptide repeats
MSKKSGKRRIQFLISRLSGLDEDDPIVSGMSPEDLEVFVSDYEGLEFDLSCEGDYSGIKLDDNDVKLLTSGLSRNFCVQSLLMWGNKEITDSSATYLQQMLQTNVTLTELNLDLTSISDSSKREIQRLLLDRRISRMSLRHPFNELTTCDLSRAGLSDSSIVRVDSVLKRNTLITSLALWGNPDLTDQGAKQLKVSLKSSTNLEHISLEMTGVSDAFKNTLSEVVRKHRLQKYLRRVQENDPQCSVLPFSNAGIAGTEMMHLCTALSTNTTITRLVLTKNPELKTKDMSNLFSVLSKTRVIHIEADWKYFDAKAASEFKKSVLLKVRNSLLQQSEYCTSVNVSELGLNNEDVLNLLSAVQSNSKLQHLNLSRNPLVSDDMAVVASLNQVVQTHPVLSKINLTGTSCSRRTLARLSEDIKNQRVSHLLDEMGSNRIESANLRGLDLKDADLEPLATALAKCTSLRRLDLSGNKRLTDRGLQALISAMDEVRADVQRSACNHTAQVR